MDEFSLYVLDITMNSVRAGADTILISLMEEDDWLTFSVTDNGCGMSKEQVEKLSNPFFTTRKTRKVGLGIPMMKENAEKAGGTFKLESEEGKGTTLTCSMDTGNIDCLPLGDLSGTLLSLMLTNPLFPDFLFEGKSPKGDIKWVL